MKAQPAILPLEAGNWVAWGGVPWARLCFSDGERYGLE
jgi:hypothetical protein